MNRADAQAAAAPELVEAEATTGVAAEIELVAEPEDEEAVPSDESRYRLRQLLGSTAEEVELRAHHRFETVLDDFDRIVVHGANRLGSELSVALRRVGIDVQCFVDPARSKWGRALAGLTIRGFPELASTDFAPFSCILAWLPPSLALRRTKIRPHSALLAEVESIGASALPWRSVALYLGAAYGDWYEQQGPRKILENTPEIAQAFDCLKSPASQAAYLRALEQRLTGGTQPKINSIQALVDPPERDPWPALEYGMPPDSSGAPCVYIDLGAGQGQGLQEFVQRCRSNFAGAFVAERNRAREGRLRETVAELQGEHQADIEMWAGAGQQDHERRLASLSAGLSHWYERVCRRLGNEVQAHLVLDLEGRETDYVLGLESWIQAARPRICASASSQVENLWELPLSLHDALPDVEIELAVDPVDAEVVVLRMTPE